MGWFNHQPDKFRSLQRISTELSLETINALDRVKAAVQLAVHRWEWSAVESTKGTLIFFLSMIEALKSQNHGIFFV